MMGAKRVKMEKTELSKSDLEELANNSFRIVLVHLRTSYKEDEVEQLHSPMNYHLHILYIKGQDSGVVTAINLDTMDVVSETTEDLSDLNKLAHDLAHIFVDKINAMMQVNKYEREKLFIKAPTQLWDRFNDIKESTFIERIGAFANYVNADSIVFEQRKKSPKKEKVLNYGWAEISLAEGREVSQSSELESATK
jgi:hypothetical protein